MFWLRLFCVFSPISALKGISIESIENSMDQLSADFEADRQAAELDRVLETQIEQIANSNSNTTTFDASAVQKSTESLPSVANSTTDIQTAASEAAGISGSPGTAQPPVIGSFSIW